MKGLESNEIFCNFELMRFNILFAACALAAIYYFPRLFWVALAVIGLATLSGVFYFRDEFIGHFKEQRKKKQEAEQKHQMAARLESAQQALDSGDETPMRALAEEGRLGDAWIRLARRYEQVSEGERDEAAITNTYKQALTCQSWVVGDSNAYESDYERRYFNGVGVTPDYQELIERWGTGYRRGERHELDLAWIYARGPESVREYEKAWWWLSLGVARNGSLRSEILPVRAHEELRTLLEAKLPSRVRDRIKEDADAEAYREFVASR